MTVTDLDRVELLLDDAQRALNEARAICRAGLNGTPGEYERLSILQAATDCVEHALAATMLDHSVRV